MERAELLERVEFYSAGELDLGAERIRLPNGIEVELPMVRHPGAAAVVPFLDADRILLIRQYRWAAGGWLWEIPAGKCRADEAPQACAERELAEEVGYRPGRLDALGPIWTVPGFSDERIHLFAAHDLEPVQRAPEADELIEVHPIELDGALAMVRSGELSDAKSLCALFQVVLRQKTGGAP